MCKSSINGICNRLIALIDPDKVLMWVDNYDDKQKTY